ncbi:MAG: DMT family transporter [Anaerofustis stercorihominis]|nr:DMT family transporter [Anaerofustis stercorihominis]
MDKKNKIFITASAMCLIGGLQFSILKIALSYFDSEIMFLWARFLFAFIAAFIFARIKKLALPKDKAVIFLSLVHPLCAFYFQSIGAAKSDVMVISVVTALFPAVASLFAFISGEETLSVKGWFSITGIVIGGLICAFFGKPGGSFFGTGVLYLFISIILRGVYYVLVHKMSVNRSCYEISYAQITYSFIGYSLIAVIFGEFDLSFVRYMPLSGWAALLYMGVISTTASYILNNYLLSSLRVSVSGALAAVTFIINLFAASFINGEELNLWIYAGSAVVIVCIIILTRERRKN